MALSTTTLKTEIADDLKEYQDFETAAASYLERQLFSAAVWLYNAYPWDFSLAQGNIVTVRGTLGPYSLAALTNFDILAPERRISKYYAYDQGDISAPIQDGDYGRRYEVTLKRSSGVVTLSFLSDPGDGTRVFTYRKKLVFADIATSWPDDEEIKELLRTRTAYRALRNTPDWAQDAANYKKQSEDALKELKLKKRAGMVRQDTREPRDVWGQALYQGYAGDVDC